MLRSRSLVVLGCPPTQPCVLACRANVLYDITAAGSIRIAGGPALKRISNAGRVHVTDDELEAAADVVVRRARALRVTCSWLLARRPRTQQEVARILAVRRQRVNQIETDGLEKLGFTLARMGANDSTQPAQWQHNATSARRAA